LANPGGLCKCGCGQKTKIAPYNNKSRNWVKGQPFDYIHGHQRKGAHLSPETKEKIRQCHIGKPLTEGHKEAVRRGAKRGTESHSYNGGLWVDNTNDGRCYINPRDGRHYVLYYRAVMECILKRPLLSTEIVHHINEDPTDDRPENLQLVPWGKHSSFSNIKYSKEEMLNALKNYVIVHGKKPTLIAWDHARLLPNIKTIKARFGTWNNALGEAGLLCAS
jgi:hypothetical protein